MAHIKPAAPAPMIMARLSDIYLDILEKFHDTRTACSKFGYFLYNCKHCDTKNLMMRNHINIQ
ncbi:hypothetical protein NBRC116188_08710 [Oceaniserpentilla sp. 4NH20-0058]